MKGILLRRYIHYPLHPQSPAPPPPLAAAAASPQFKEFCRPMEAQMQNITLPSPSVKSTFRLGSETYSVQADKGILSDQLVSMKAESMVILKDFITRHNVPTDVPDEPDEPSSEDEGEIPVKSKKRK